MGDPETAAAEKVQEKDENTTRKGQRLIPGMKPKRIKALEDKAEEVKELQDERIEIQGREDKAREELKDLMVEHKLKHYPLDDEREVILESSEVKAFVRKIKGRRKPKLEKAD